MIFPSKVWLKFPWFAKVEFEGSTIGRCLVVACAAAASEVKKIGLYRSSSYHTYITHTHTHILLMAEILHQLTGIYCSSYTDGGTVDG